MADDLYREVLLDHYHDPRGRDPITGVTATASGDNPLCGDECDVRVRLAGDRIEAVQVEGRGCAISVAAGSILAELVEGLTVDDARSLTEALRGLLRGEPVPDDLDLGDLEALAGVQRFPMRVKCAMLPWVTLVQALVEAGER
jgi:nitrogen fixation NifU-like protein